MGEPPPTPELAAALNRPLDVWETAAWLHATHRVVAARAGTWEIVREWDVVPGDGVLSDELAPVSLTVNDDGTFVATPDPSRGCHVFLYRRTDPLRQQEALRVAVPKWYQTFGERLAP